MTADLYPTESALKEIEEWDFKRGWLPLMEKIKRIWWMPDWGWHEEDGEDDLFHNPVRRFKISTGGWSGNEEIIESMRKNFIFWTLNWINHRRGGHYIFEVDISDRTKSKTD